MTKQAVLAEHDYFDLNCWVVESCRLRLLWLALGAKMWQVSLSESSPACAAVVYVARRRH